jgi:hypothetical protein
MGCDDRPWARCAVLKLGGSEEDVDSRSSGSDVGSRSGDVA